MHRPRQHFTFFLIASYFDSIYAGEYEQHYNALDGCSTNSQKDFEDLSPGYYPGISRVAEIVCCSSDGKSCSRMNQGSCRSGNGDSKKMSWMEANKNCKDSGMRLCQSQEELDRCCAKGCQYDNQLVWTNTRQSIIKNPASCDKSNPTYIGCFSDDSHRDLSDGPKKYGYDQSSCNEACKEYTYFALQAGGWCVCGNDFGTESQYVQKHDSECGGPRGLGRGWRNSIYKTCVTPEFKKEMGKFCPFCNKTFHTMEDAKDNCRSDPNCGIIYDLFCDGVGYFCICPIEDVIKQAHPNGIDCIYKRKK